MAMTTGTVNTIRTITIKTSSGIPIGPIWLVVAVCDGQSSQPGFGGQEDSHSLRMHKSANLNALVRFPAHTGNMWIASPDG